MFHCLTADCVMIFYSKGALAAMKTGIYLACLHCYNFNNIEMHQCVGITDDLVVDNHTQVKAICLHIAFIGKITLSDICSHNHALWE